MSGFLLLLGHNRTHVERGRGVKVGRPPKNYVATIQPENRTSQQPIY